MRIFWHQNNGLHFRVLNKKFYTILFQNVHLKIANKILLGVHNIHYNVQLFFQHLRDTLCVFMISVMSQTYS